MSLTEQAAILEAARHLYEAIPAAEFTTVTLRQLAEASDRGDEWKTLPNPVKLCVIKLVIALGMTGNNDTESAPNEETRPETSEPIIPEVLPPARKEEEPADREHE